MTASFDESKNLLLKSDKTIKKNDGHEYSEIDHPVISCISFLFRMNVIKAS